jgi:hypothetical protein
VRNRKSAPHRALIARAGILLCCLLVGGPAAQAAFTGSASAGALTAGAHKLAAPTRDTTAKCDATGNSGKYRLEIDVFSHGTVPKASHYVLTVVEPNGTKRYTEDLTPAEEDKSKPAGEHKSKPAGTVQWSYELKTAGPGQWSYSIDAQYRVPGSTNIWTSDSTQSSVTVNCQPD